MKKEIEYQNQLSFMAGQSLAKAYGGLRINGRRTLRVVTLLAVSAWGVTECSGASQEATEPSQGTEPRAGFTRSISATTSNSDEQELTTVQVLTNFEKYRRELGLELDQLQNTVKTDKFLRSLVGFIKLLQHQNLRLNQELYFSLLRTESENQRLLDAGNVWDSSAVHVIKALEQNAGKVSIAGETYAAEDVDNTYGVDWSFKSQQVALSREELKKKAYMEVCIKVMAAQISNKFGKVGEEVDITTTDGSKSKPEILTTYVTGVEKSGLTRQNFLTGALEWMSKTRMLGGSEIDQGKMLINVHVKKKTAQSDATFMKSYFIPFNLNSMSQAGVKMSINSALFIDKYDEGVDQASQTVQTSAHANELEDILDDIAKTNEARLGNARLGNGGIFYWRMEEYPNCIRLWLADGNIGNLTWKAAGQWKIQ